MRERDVGMHVVVARRVAGAAKMMYEPITSRLREVSPAALLLSGDRPADSSADADLGRVRNVAGGLVER